jgi:serine/threonine protein kinase
VLWSAYDEVLARPVAARVLTGGPSGAGAPAQQALISAATAAGAVSHPVLAQVYDAAREPSAGVGSVAYAISEWVSGPTLAALLVAEGPWEPARACALVTDVADALAAAHQTGLAHGRVHLGNLLLPAAGGVRLTDLALSAALPGRRVPAQRSADPFPRAADVRDLAAVLYALLTARWPASATPQPSGGLPVAPTGRDGPRRGRLISPGQVRAGVPRSLDAVVARALDPTRAALSPDLTTTAGLCDALHGGRSAPKGTRRMRGVLRRRRA